MLFTFLFAHFSHKFALLSALTILNIQFYGLHKLNCPSLAHLRHPQDHLQNRPGEGGQHAQENRQKLQQLRGLPAVAEAFAKGERVL